MGILGQTTVCGINDFNHTCLSTLNCLCWKNIVWVIFNLATPTVHENDLRYNSQCNCCALCGQNFLSFNGLYGGFPGAPPAVCHVKLQINQWVTFLHISSKGKLSNNVSKISHKSTGYFCVFLLTNRQTKQSNKKQPK